MEGATTITMANPRDNYTRAGEPFARFGAFHRADTHETYEVGKCYRTAPCFRMGPGYFLVTSIYKDPVGWSMTDGRIRIGGFVTYDRWQGRDDDFAPEGWRLGVLFEDCNPVDDHPVPLPWPCTRINIYHGDSRVQ